MKHFGRRRRRPGKSERVFIIITLVMADIAVMPLWNVLRNAFNTAAVWS